MISNIQLYYDKRFINNSDAVFKRIFHKGISNIGSI